jgi:uncharacterized membrane protein YccF (DUF307 family)
MHCPRCGQQQVSTETRYCSRCGFQLALVSEILQHGGTLPQLSELTQKKTLFNKKNGVVFSAVWFIFFTLFLTSMSGIMDAPEQIIAAFAVFGIFGSLSLAILSLAVLPSSRPLRSRVLDPLQPPAMNPPTAQGALPPQTDQPASVYTAPGAGAWRMPETGEFSRPGSVVEGTTKLLNHEEK